MEKQVVGRFLLGAGLGGLVGTGVLALVSVSLSGPFPQQRSAGPLREAETGVEVAGEPGTAAGLAAPEKAADPAEPGKDTASANAGPTPDAELTVAPEAPATEMAPQPGPEIAATPDLSETPDLPSLPAVGTELTENVLPGAAPTADPALEAALDAAFAAGGDPGDSEAGAAPEGVPGQPAGLADAASDAVPQAQIAPEATPEIAGIAAGGTVSPPDALAGLPEPAQLPEGLSASQPVQPGTGAEASRPANPAEDSAPALVLAPEPPPLTEAEELMLAQMAADELLEDAPPAAELPVLPSLVLPSNDNFVILDELPPQGSAKPVPEAAEAPAQPAPAAPEPVELAQEETAPADPAPAPATETAEAPARILALDDSPTLQDPGTEPGNATGAGVETRRLPRIGDTPAAPATDPASDPVLAGEAAAEPRHAFARPFENAANKPRFAVILIDDGSSGLDRTALADLPFPVSFAIDPQLPNASEIAALYRAAGQEVIMLGSGLPKGAGASDIAVAFEAMARALPEAVAVMDLPSRAFQGDRALASLVVPEIQGQGRGLVTWNIGLNAADQVAKREDVPSAVIFRDLDAEDEAAPVIRRYLDRAAFKAAQEGAVTVVGRAAHGPTLAALLEWAVEGRAASVELAPVTAMLSVD